MENTFGESIKELRVNSNTTQKDLAEKLGISPASIIAYEKGQKSPSIDVAVKLASHFGASLDTLCGLDKSKYHFKSYGEIARALCAILETKHFQLIMSSENPGYEEALIIERATDEWVEITPNVDMDEDGNFTSSTLNDFLVKYRKMLVLLSDNTLPKGIFDTWLESEFSNLDKTLLEDIDHAET